MELKFVLFSAVVLLYFLIFGVMGDDSANKTSERRKSRDVAPYMGLISCAVKYDVTCFVNAAEDFLEVRRTELLAEADAQVVQSGRASDSSENKPSHIANTLSRLISELTSMFQNGLSGFFKAGEDDLEEDEDEEPQKESDNSELTTTTDQSNGVASRGATSSARGHKHSYHEGFITKIVRVVKLALYSLVLFLFEVTVLTMFNAFVGFKFLLVAMWGVALLALKVWLQAKDSGGTVVVHEDVHHDHHYEDEHHYDHLPVDDWHRSYLPKEDYGSHKLAYSAQKPAKSIWTSWLD